MSAPGPTGERQEHLDAIVSFAGAGQRRRLLRGLDILTIKWAPGDLPGDCRFLLNTHLMFLKIKKDTTSKQFDDDEWIRSLTEAQEVTADIPEDIVTYDQQDVDSKKVRPIQMGEFMRKYVWHSVRERLQPSRLRCGRSEWALQVALRPWPSFISKLLNDEWMTGSLRGPLARIKVLVASRFLPKHTAALNKKGSRQCRRIGVQSKETSMAHWSEAWPLEWWQEMRGSIAARQAAGALPWIGVSDSAEEQRLQADH